MDDEGIEYAQYAPDNGYGTVPGNYDYVDDEFELSPPSGDFDQAYEDQHHWTDDIGNYMRLIMHSYVAYYETLSENSSPSLPERVVANFHPRCAQRPFPQYTPQTSRTFEDYDAIAQFDAPDSPFAYGLAPVSPPVRPIASSSAPRQPEPAFRSTFQPRSTQQRSKLIDRFTSSVHSSRPRLYQPAISPTYIFQ